MKYRVIGETFPVVEIGLNRGESMITQAGGMSWMTDGMEMNTSMKGGLGKAFKRSMTGESMFQVRYTANRDNQLIAFGAHFPGKIVPIDVSKRKVVAQKGAFLASQPTVDLDWHVVRNLGSAFLGGEGMFMLKFGGKGIAFLEVSGYPVEMELGPGEVIRVDTGNVAYFDDTCSYEIETVKGVKNVFFGGEGLFNTRITGPGKVCLQTMEFLPPAVTTT